MLAIIIVIVITRRKSLYINQKTQRSWVSLDCSLSAASSTSGRSKTAQCQTVSSDCGLDNFPNNISYFQTAAVDHPVGPVPAMAVGATTVARIALRNNRQTEQHFS